MKKTINGVYVRKSDSAHLSYTAFVHEDQIAFSARVYDSSGALVGSTLVFPSRFSLAIDAQCKRWIEDYIEQDMSSLRLSAHSGGD